jgi:hypothetical protein
VRLLLSYCVRCYSGKIGVSSSLPEKCELTPIFSVFHAMSLHDLSAVDREGLPFNLIEGGRVLRELF